MTSEERIELINNCRDGARRLKEKRDAVIQEFATIKTADDIERTQARMMSQVNELIAQLPMMKSEHMQAIVHQVAAFKHAQDYSMHNLLNAIMKINTVEVEEEEKVDIRRSIFSYLPERNTVLTYLMIVIPSFLVGAVASNVISEPGNVDAWLTFGMAGSAGGMIATLLSMFKIY